MTNKIRMGGTFSFFCTSAPSFFPHGVGLIHQSGKWKSKVEFRSLFSHFLPDASLFCSGPNGNTRGVV